jgi:hypothetical protein
MRKGYGDSGIGLLYKVVASVSGIKQFKVMWPSGEISRASAAIMERVK